MSFPVVSQDALAVATADLTTIGSAVQHVNEAASSSTTTLVAAAADEVSQAIATLLGAPGDSTNSSAPN